MKLRLITESSIARLRRGNRCDQVSPLLEVNWWMQRKTSGAFWSVQLPRAGHSGGKSHQPICALGSANPPSSPQSEGTFSQVFNKTTWLKDPFFVLSAERTLYKSFERSEKHLYSRVFAPFLQKGLSKGRSLIRKKKSSKNVMELLQTLQTAFKSFDISTAITVFFGAGIGAVIRHYWPQNNEAKVIISETVTETITRICKDEMVDPQLALRVAKCESGLNPIAIHGNGDGSYDHGLFQINDKYHPDVSMSQAFDVEFSTRFFCRAFKNGHLDWWSASKKCWNI